LTLPFWWTDVLDNAVAENQVKLTRLKLLDVAGIALDVREAVIAIRRSLNLAGEIQDGDVQSQRHMPPDVGMAAHVEDSRPRSDPCDLEE
jgi:hypothetical protein